MQEPSPGILLPALAICGCFSTISLVLAAVALNVSQENGSSIDIGGSIGGQTQQSDSATPPGYWVPPWVKVGCFFALLCQDMLGL